MSKSTRRCPRCGDDFPSETFGTRPYCKGCFNAYARERRRAKAEANPRTCAHCGGLFVRTNGRMILCSPECVVAQRREARGVPAPSFAHCRNCGTEFMRSRADSTHCSSKCQDATKYAAQRNDPEFKARRSAAWLKYSAANREQVLASGRAWRRSNPDRLKASQKAWAERNRYTYKNSWRRKFPDKHAAKQRARTVRLRELTPFPLENDLVMAKIAYWGGKCWICGVEYTAVDHVKPLAKRGLNIVANLRPICVSCNSRKRDRWFGATRLSDLIP